MNENTKTISFIFTAAAVLVLAWAFRPAAPPLVTDEMVGKSLFPELDDPLKAKKMRIVTFDEGTSQVREFEVAQANGVWSLPSHQNYPADAKDQLASAVSALVDLKVLAAGEQRCPGSGVVRRGGAEAGGGSVRPTGCRKIDGSRG